MKAQEVIGYLLLIGGAILVVAIVVVFIIQMIIIFTEYAQTDAFCQSKGYAGGMRWQQPTDRMFIEQEGIRCWNTVQKTRCTPDKEFCQTTPEYEYKFFPLIEGETT